MEQIRNRFKAAIRAGQHQLGIWNALGGPSSPELLASCGFDWVLVDTEHAPVDVLGVLPALQAIAGYPQTSAVVRAAANDPVLIKRLLDLGAQSLMIPYVQSVAEAEAAVAAIRYPPHGIRGVAGVTRASRFGKVPDYAARAGEELCLLVQVETVPAMEQLAGIAGVDGVDGVFIGPSDLAASMGFVGQPGHPEVMAAVDGMIATLRAMNVPAGFLSTNPEICRHVIGQGTTFTAVGTDLSLLNAAAVALRESFAG